MNKYNTCLFSYCRTAAFYPESGNKFNPPSAQMHFKSHLPHPMRIQWLYTLWNAWSSLFSQPDLFYFVQQPDTPGRRTRSWWPMCHADAQPPHAYKKKRNKNRNASHHSFFHSCSIFMTISCFYIKYKGNEKKELREIQFKKYLKSNGRSLLRSEKNFTALCIWNWEENRPQSELIPFLHILQILRFITHCRLKPFHRACSVSQTGSVSTDCFFTRKASVLMAL